jgi:hypothetical protein
MGIAMVQNRALDTGACSKSQKNRHSEDDAAHLAGRFGWAYRTAIAALEHLEASGAAMCVSRRGRAMWALTA